MLQRILELIFRKIEEFNFSIVNCRILSAQYLDENNIIAQHYGVINKASSNAKMNLSPGARKQFNELFGIPVESANIKGGLEFLKDLPFFNPISLDFLWQNSPAQKLGGGIYAQKIKFDGVDYYLINGFHPRQLSHFTEKGRSIITFTLESDTEWQIARDKFIGKTNPKDAEPGSIRNELFVNAEKLGLSNISSSWNGVHLSAGPVEGLIELIRYNSDFSKNDIKTVKDFSFGKKILSVFSQEDVDNILNNQPVTYENKLVSVFDLTEEKNSEEALQVLKEVFGKQK